MLIRPFFKVRKYFKLLEHKHIMYYLEACNIWRLQLYNLFREILKLIIKTIINFAKFGNTFVQNLNMSRNKLYSGISRSCALK